MERGLEKGKREEKEEERVRETEGVREGGGEEKRRCSSSSLSQAPGTVCSRFECEAPESSLVAVTQRRLARRATGIRAPTRGRREEREEEEKVREDIAAKCFVVTAGCQKKK